MSVTTPVRPPSQDELQALIEEARRRARRRRRRNGIVLLLAVLVGAGLYVLVAQVGGRGAGSARGGRVIGASPRAFRAGQFWYTRTVSSRHQWLPAGGTIESRGGYFHPRGAEVEFDVRLVEETWVGVDGTMRDRVTAVPRFASAEGRETWERTRPLVAPDAGFAAASRRPLPNLNLWLGRDTITVGGDMFPPQLWYPWGEGRSPCCLDLGDRLFSYRQLLSLPMGPTALLGRLKRAEANKAQNARQVVAASTGALGELNDIGGLLASPLPARARIALFRSAVALPGVRVNARARDSLGRRGVAVSGSAGIAAARLIFDPATGALLEGPRGAVVAQGVVASVNAIPKGTGPVHTVGGPAEPPTLAISPRAGNPRTVFTLVLRSPTARPAREPPALEWVLAATDPRCFASGFGHPLLASASTWLAGKPAYVYRLGSPRAHGRAWCAGTYELNVVPDYSTRPQASQPASAGSPTFSPGTASSIFFQVR